MALQIFTRKSITSSLTRSARIVLPGSTPGSVSRPTIGTVRIISARIRINYSWVNQHVTSPTGDPFPPTWLKLTNGTKGPLPSGKEFVAQLRSWFMKGVKRIRYLDIPPDLRSASLPPHLKSAINVDSWIVNKRGLTFQVGVVARSPEDGKLIFAMHAFFDLSLMLPFGISKPKMLDMNLVETAGLSFATVIADDNQLVDPLFLSDSSYGEGLLCRNHRNRFGSPSLFLFGLSLKFIWLNPPKGETFGSIAHVKGESENCVADALSKWGPKKKIGDGDVFKIARSELASFRVLFVEKSKTGQKIKKGMNFERLVRVLVILFR